MFIVWHFNRINFIWILFLISNWLVSNFLTKNMKKKIKNSVDTNESKFQKWIKKLFDIILPVTRTESIWNQTLVTFLTTWCVFFVNRSIEIAIFKFRSYLKSIEPPNCDGKSFWFTHSPFEIFKKIKKKSKIKFFKKFKHEFFQKIREILTNQKA